MKATILTTLALGVSLCLADEINQSEPEVVSKGPITAPEVVLQLKYDGGELNRIYLTQFRKGQNAGAPSVPARIDLCADLCHAGLGGPPCGHSCPAMLPVGLQTALAADNASDPVLGQPRTSVCPTLCTFGLGDPLCQCGEVEAAEIEWPAVCAAFCDSDGYILRGCPPCAPAAPHSVITPGFASTRVLAAGWGAWCDVQCAQGHGGAACNCHRTPFL